MRAFIVLSGLFVILFLANPDEEDFTDFVKERVESAIEARTEQSAFGEMISGASGVAVDLFVDEFMERQNFLFFSIYTIDYDGDSTDDDEWKFLGFMTTFRELNRPDDDSNPIGVVE